MLERRQSARAVVVLCALAAGASVARAENAVQLGKGFGSRGEIAEVPILVSADLPLHGFVIVMEWDSAKASPEAIIARDGTGEPLENVDLVVTQLNESYAIFGMSVDVDSRGVPFVEAGQDVEVGVLQLRCLGPPEGVEEEEFAVRLVDNVYRYEPGLPLLANFILHYSKFINVEYQDLVLYHGSVLCMAEPPGGEGGTAFACGGPLGQNGLPTEIQASIGDQPSVGFYYRRPANGPDGPQAQIQGFSMAGLFDCNLTGLPDTFDMSGTILEAAQPEFVSVEIDNLSNSADGDGCEYVVGVLVDAEAPFDGRTLPPAEGFEKLFEIDFEVGIDAFCGGCLPIRFVDGVSGNGDVPTKNLISANFQSISPELFHCAVCVTGRPEFVRGDCNFSTTSGTPVDIADAAAIVGYVFLEGDDRFEAPCESACDSNDDGRLDASDVVFLLEYLFVPDSPEPPAPGPLFPGIDPTPDELTCEAGPLDCS